MRDVLDDNLLALASCQNDRDDIAEKGMAYLGLTSHDAVKDGLVCGITESAITSCLLIVLVPFAESFGPEVEGIAERLMDAIEVFPGHEYLQLVSIRNPHT